jgi:IrrE N-terminal-like domain
LEQYRSNPAIAFLKNPQDIECPEDLVRGYAHYLLKEARVYQLPIKLDVIRHHFNFPVHYQQLPPEERGCITDDLRIYLNAGDRSTVQQFTLAHEFMEVLFFALKEGAADDWMSDQLFEALQKRKERLCDAGAAELLMPLPLFREFVSQSPVSLKWAQEIAFYCKLSLMAILRQIVESDLSPMALIFWSHKHRPKEFVPSKIGQGNLFGSMEEMDPPKKMRVDRCFISPGLQLYVPRDKSVPLTSSIHRAYVEGVTTAEFEEIDLVNIRGRYFVESLPYNVTGERQVMSLIHLKRDVLTTEKQTKICFPT